MAEEGSPRGRVAPPWLEWVRALQSIAQAGLTYGRDPYDIERYRHVRRIAAEIAGAVSRGDSDRIEAFFASQHGYPTPKIDVRAAVIVEGRILLVQERDDRCWSMPGGWADVGESAAESAVRETREEAGIDVRAVNLIALYERERHGHPLHPEFSYKAFFACEPCHASVHPAMSSCADGTNEFETLAAGFFAPDDLPPLSLARITPEEVALAFEHARDPRLPTAFD